MTIELQPEFPHRTRKKDKLSPGAAKSTSVPYVELHAHSSYSFLDGASLPEELAVSAAELGYPALALTDHDGVYGSLEFAHAAKHFGVRPITGAEVSVGEAHVTLLCETQRGYANPCRDEPRRARAARGRARRAVGVRPQWPRRRRRTRRGTACARVHGCVLRRV